jgi:hypothetical protein
MPHYLLSICYPADAVPPQPAELDEIMRRVEALKADLRAAGSWVFGDGLHDPGSATVVDGRTGDHVMTDGPFVETKEMVGGIVVIKVADLDQALSWAGRLTDATGVPIEVRPFQGGES